MKIKKISAKITEIKELSQTAREVHIDLSENLDFIPGSFVNVFIEHEGENMRRAYSVSSDSTEQKQITISVRKKPEGKVSKLFWLDDIIGKTITVMGPMGLNTTDKISEKKVFLFSFGIGISVIKGVLHSLLERPDTEITIFTQDRNEDELLYNEFLQQIRAENPSRVDVRRIISDPERSGYPLVGTIQDYLTGVAFDNSCVYICGPEKACESLKETIEAKNPQNVNYMIEGFH